MHDLNKKTPTFGAAHQYTSEPLEITKTSLGCFGNVQNWWYNLKAELEVLGFFQQFGYYGYKNNVYLTLEKSAETTIKHL